MKNKIISQKLIELMALIEKDLYKFMVGNKMAGRRARVNLIKLEKAGKEFRKESSQSKLQRVYQRNAWFKPQ
jgi:hypothetical protein